METNDKEIMIVGIDCGLDGGISYVDMSGKLRNVHSMPLRLADKEVDIRSLYGEFVKNMQFFDIRFSVELCQYTPALKGKSAFTFGKVCQVVEDAILLTGNPVNWVRPQEWKKHFSLIGKEKKDSVIKAIELFPEYENIFTYKKRGGSIGIKDGLAESSLIAEYYRRISNVHRPTK